MQSTRISLFGLYFSGLAAVAFIGCSTAPNNNTGTDSDAGTTGMDSGPAVVMDAGHVPDAGPHGDAGPPANTNLSFATATPITVSATTAPTAGALAPTPDHSDITANFYSFSGTAGQRLVINTTAVGLVPTAMLNEANIIDTVVTVYTSAQAQIAQDDDAFPKVTTDSQLFFQVPTTGMYFIQVATCVTLFGTNNCAPVSGVTVFNYTLSVIPLDATTEVNATGAANGTVATAKAMPFSPVQNMPGSYYENIVDGDFTSTTDTLVYSFTPPTALTAVTGIVDRTDIYVQPVGTSNGDGSTSNIKAWVTDSTGTTVLGGATQSNFMDGDNLTNGPLDLAVPITFGTQYLLYVQNAAATSTPATDYFFALATSGSDSGGATPEAEGATGTAVNDTIITAQKLANPNAMNFVAGYYSVQGNLSSGTDVDWYEVDRTAGTTKTTITCQASRAGSGLRQLTVGLYTKDTTTMMPVAITGTSGVEAINKDLVIGGQTPIVLPTGPTQFFLKVSAAGTQDSVITGTYYYCQVLHQ